MGFLQKYNYFWNLFISDRKGLDTPVLIYLRGELGHGSVMKVYNGIGPIIIGPGKKLISNPASITKNFHLLAIDFPCNIGFTNDTNFRCPPLPANPRGGLPGFKELADSIASSLQDFYNYKNPNCNLNQMLQLNHFLWSESFASPMTFYMATSLKNYIKSIKIKGILLGDPMIDLLRQNQNFASYGLMRSVGSSDTYRFNLQQETIIQMIGNKATSSTFCKFYQGLFAKFDLTSICPYDLQTPCTPLQGYANSNSSCEMFYNEPSETDQDNPILKVLMDKMKILKYNVNTTAVLNDTQPNSLNIFYDDVSTDFANTVNSLPLLIYQSQHNWVANSIALMLFADGLRWSGYDNYVQTDTKYFVVDNNNKQMRYTMRAYGNYYKAQIFGVGGLYTYRTSPYILRDHIFQQFCYGR